jgi:hypothetical protein
MLRILSVPEHRNVAIRNVLRQAAGQRIAGATAQLRKRAEPVSAPLLVALECRLY